MAIETKLKKTDIGGVTMIQGYLAVGLWLLIFIMMESILLENVVKKRHRNSNGEMLIIYGSNAGFGGDNITYYPVKKSSVIISKIIYNSIIIDRLSVHNLL